MERKIEFSLSERLKALNDIRNNEEEWEQIWETYEDIFDEEDLYTIVTMAINPSAKILALEEMRKRGFLSISKIYDIAMKFPSVEVFTECVKLLIDLYNSGESVSGYLRDLSRLDLFEHIAPNLKEEADAIIKKLGETQRKQLSEILDNQ